MEQTANPMPFDEWATSVDELCRRHFACSWDGLAGDLHPLQNSHASGETPRQFVEWLARKFDLIWADAIPYSDRNRLS